MAKKIGDWYNYSGAIHMHTTESDGTKPLEEVVAIGQKAGLDFMLFTDHMTLSLRDAGKEEFYGKTLVIIGYEHNDPQDKNHYLIFQSPRVYDEKFSVKQYVSAAAQDSAIGIMAHPDEIRDRLVEYPPYPWTDWSVEGFTGIELWNQMSEWMEKLTRFNKLLMS
ncbi:MAG TPA: PHP domain-containing protein, partial [candidate division Zixibacteria bacterium]|nr:PHP domain-containing protein [candidate division Zixibacteria bacterium]